MNIKTAYRKYKINNVNHNGNNLKNIYLLVDTEYTGFFIGEIKDDAEANPLNMDRIITFYPIRKSEIEIFKESLNNLKEINAAIIELQINLQLNSNNIIYRR